MYQLDWPGDSYWFDQVSMIYNVKQKRIMNITSNLFSFSLSNSCIKRKKWDVCTWRVNFLMVVFIMNENNGLYLGLLVLMRSYFFFSKRVFFSIDIWHWIFKRITHTIYTHKIIYTKYIYHCFYKYWCFHIWNTLVVQLNGL